ncbi:sensor histidine kinase [Clostridium sp. 19966]|uniref:sensor histidine kinase n=1 Tax=Clostridium sp. 19966 TaxID=2768166 RepID=UPI0028DDF513|nr:sensor histidine kinase [Clostridium sp. 19966]MDT8716924.1 sensor histidine kinase [Clostridium sp. 19966]
MDLDANDINGIIKNVLNAIESSRQQVFDIVENINREVENLKLQMQRLKNDISKIIEEVDELERLDKSKRKLLAEISSNLKKYTEKDIKEAYEKASDIRTRFLTKQNEERLLRKQRDGLEMSLKKAMNNVERGEKIINQISIAMNYLQDGILSALDEAEKNSNITMAMKILEAQESERERIARDIHDGPAQNMANAVMKVDICKIIIKKDVSEGIKELDELKESVKAALKEVRRIIFNLRPVSLEELGPVESIKQMVNSITEESLIAVKLNLNPAEIDIDHIIQVALYRIIQEILNNIIKHSKADNAEIKLYFGNQYLMLIISDNGQGFDVNKTLRQVKEKGTSYGLIGIIDRVKQLQGDIKIRSQEGKGTTYIIKLPVNREVIKNEKPRS